MRFFYIIIIAQLTNCKQSAKEVNSRTETSSLTTAHPSYSPQVIPSKTDIAKTQQQSDGASTGVTANNTPSDTASSSSDSSNPDSSSPDTNSQSGASSSSTSTLSKDTTASLLLAEDPPSLWLDASVATFTTPPLNKPRGNYLIQADADKGLESSMVNCPGSSVLVGNESRYFTAKGDATGDRIWQLKCRDLVDNHSRPVTRKNCEVSDWANDYSDLSSSFSCKKENTFIVGQESKAIIDGSSKSKRVLDQQFRYNCCELYTFDNKPIIFPETAVQDINGKDTKIKKKDCEPVVDYDLNPDIQDGRSASFSNDIVNTKLGILVFECQLGQNGEQRVIQEIRTMYEEGVNQVMNGQKIESATDRRFSYKCCTVNVEGAIPAAPSDPSQL